MDRNDRKPKKDRTSEPDPDLLMHIRSLGLSNVEEYIRVVCPERLRSPHAQALATAVEGT